ncbi:MAG: leucine-rich repeat protein [Lachnospiraceae bacterium]|nr:leucine-rich repeat protein [Lachnospiraceae bacterium]
MEIFIERLLYSAVAAGIMIAVIIVARPFLKRLPKWISLLLWLIVGLRLVLPVSISSPFSLVPSAETMGIADMSERNIKSFGGQKVDSTGEVEENIVLGRTEADDRAKIVDMTEEIGSAKEQDTIESFELADKTDIATETVSIDRTGFEENTKASISYYVKTVFMYIWPVGCAVIILYIGINMIILRRKVRFSIPVRNDELIKLLGKDRNINEAWQINEIPAVKMYICDEVDSPFVLGLFDQKLYIPADMSGETLRFVIMHENAHIRHLDPVLKMIAVMLAAVYWFNPLVWIGFILFNRDIELACDERAVGRMEKNEKIAYSEALLYCGKYRRNISICSVAFGETSVSERVKSVLRYKKPSKTVVTIAIVFCLAFAGCFLTDANAADHLGNNNEKQYPESGISGKETRSEDLRSSGISGDYTIRNNVENRKNEDETVSSNNTANAKVGDKAVTSDNAENVKFEDITILGDNAAHVKAENETVLGENDENVNDKANLETASDGNISEEKNETVEEKNVRSDEDTNDEKFTDSESINTASVNEKQENEPGDTNITAGMTGDETDDGKVDTEDRNEDAKKAESGTKTVDRIESNGNKDRKNDNATAANAIIPAGIKKIKDKAFFFVLSIKTVIIPDSVTQIGRSAFSHCENLESVSLPEGIKNIPQGCFDSCYSLEKAYLPEGITVIDDYAFADCRNLQVITIPESVQEIGKYAFKGCSGLSDETMSRIYDINPDVEF